jgi:hypothetical protein
MKRMRVGISAIEGLEATHLPALRSLPLHVEIVRDASQPVDASLVDGVLVVDGARVVPYALVEDPAWAPARTWVQELDGVALARVSILIGGRDGEAGDHTQGANGGRQAVADAVVDASSVLVDLFGGGIDVEVVTPFRDGVDAVLRAGGTTISVTVTRLDGGRSERRLELLAPAGRVAVDFASPFVFGTPSIATRTTRAGTEIATPRHENGWRAFWRRIHEQWSEGRVESNAPQAAATQALASRLSPNS